MAFNYIFKIVGNCVTNVTFGAMAQCLIAC